MSLGVTASSQVIVMHDANWQRANGRRLKPKPYLKMEWEWEGRGVISINSNNDSRLANKWLARGDCKGRATRKILKILENHNLIDVIGLHFAK